MVSKDEIIQQLIEKNIILCVADKYILTEKYKDLLELDIKMLPTPEQVEKPTLNSEVLNFKNNGSDWPTEILETKGLSRAFHIMEACEVPLKSPDGSFLLRGVDNEAANILGNIVDSGEYSPPDFIACVADYYATMERVKAFKNFLKEGDFMGVYKEWMEGGGKPKVGNKRWS